MPFFRSDRVFHRHYSNILARIGVGVKKAPELRKQSRGQPTPLPLSNWRDTMSVPKSFPFGPDSFESVA